MHKEEVGYIQEFLAGRIGESKGLSDWCSEINNHSIGKKRLIRRRLTTREFAFIVNRIIKNKIMVERTSDPIQYKFSQLVTE